MSNNQNYTIERRQNVVTFEADKMSNGQLCLIVGGPYDGHFVLKRNVGFLQNITNSAVSFSNTYGLYVRNLLPGEEYLIRCVSPEST